MNSRADIPKPAEAGCPSATPLSGFEAGIPEFASLAAGMKRDKAAIETALTLATSNGQVEGQVNRLKLVKRSMYGRAKLDPLRQRVLPP